MDQDDIRPRKLASGAEEADREDSTVTPVVCPFCHSSETELVSLFGGQLSTDQYYCRACRTYFERFARDAERDEEGDIDE